MLPNAQLAFLCILSSLPIGGEYLGEWTLQSLIMDYSNSFKFGIWIRWHYIWKTHNYLFLPTSLSLSYAAFHVLFCWCAASQNNLVTQFWLYFEYYFMDCKKNIQCKSCGLNFTWCSLLNHVWLFGIPWTIVHQGPLSMDFSRQEYWSW